MYEMSSGFFGVFYVATIVVFIAWLALSKKKNKAQIELLDQKLKEEKEKTLEIEKKYAPILDIEVERENARKVFELEKSEYIEQMEVERVKALDLIERQVDSSKRQKAKIESDILNLQVEHNSKKSDWEEKIRNLKSEYRSKKHTYDELVKYVALYEEEADLINLGFYSPNFSFETSEQFKQEIKTCKDEQKALLRDKTSLGAIYCTTERVVGDSKSAGKKMTDKNIRLAARAFNNECEAAIANCTWKNVIKMEERIKKAFDAINKLNESNHIYITERYLNAKLLELKLTYEYHQKRQDEKEEQAEIKAQMREEARVEAEIKKAELEAIKEEKRYQKALNDARKELERATEVERLKLEIKIEELEVNLREAELKHQRAQSMAEQTRKGHVYIISNIGSFGENIYKIGMTRRLEPMDRVKELGDASVPFTFDVHAMIYTADAPTLEKKLHEKFNRNRLNMVNRRKEFFSVSLSDIKRAVLSFVDDDVEFIETATAQDYYETKAMKNRSSSDISRVQTKPNEPVFSDTI